jgi:SRSO17 transposase
MTSEQIQALGPAFTNYSRPYDLCRDHPQTSRLLGVYCHGLLSDLDRKSAGPIALAGGVAVRTSQEFLKDHRWSFQPAKQILQADVRATLAEVPGGDLGTVGIVDATPRVKKGTKTPGVQRQWRGAAGKLENRIVTVHLGVAKGRYKALIDAELFLPQSWADDRDRCREADIPDGMAHRPKWRIALRQVVEARLAGLGLDWLTFDEGYGGKPGLLDGLDLPGLSYVGEVPCSFRCFSRRPRGGEAGHRADGLARHGPAFHAQPWQEVTMSRQTLGGQTWRARMAPVYVWHASRREAVRRWLIVARHEPTGEVKYLVAGGREAGLSTRLRVGFTRYNVEHGFRLGKSELGWGHCEGRSRVGLTRHLTPCLVTGGFVAKQAARLRGEKPGGDGRAGVPGVEPALVVVATGATPTGLGGAIGGHDSTPPAAESGGPRVPATSGGGIANYPSKSPPTPSEKTTKTHFAIVAL